MADTVYFLSSREQSRLVSTLNLSKVERLSVQPGQLGDESVELVIEHSLDFLPGTVTAIDSLTIKLYRE